jgi:hypothetical protein
LDINGDELRRRACVADYETGQIKATLSGIFAKSRKLRLQRVTWSKSQLINRLASTSKTQWRDAGSIHRDEKANLISDAKRSST